MVKRAKAFFITPIGRYLAALLAITASVAVAFSLRLGIRGGRLIPLIALAFAAWSGYGPGMLATVLLVLGVPFRSTRSSHLARSISADSAS